MAKIFYSMCGEGRGHASRVRAMVEQLRHRHLLVLYAPEQAYDFLAPKYANVPGVEVRRIPGVRFHYRNGRLHFLGTIGKFLHYLWQGLPLVRTLQEAIRRERPSVVVVDFEPLLPWAARRCRVPVVSLDHQHFLLAFDLSSLPSALRQHARLMRWLVWLHSGRSTDTIVSGFYTAERRPGWQHVQTVGPLLRPEVLAATPTPGEYFLTYVRPCENDRLFAQLRACGRDVRVYGLGERPAEGRLSYFPIDERQFVLDLAGCAAYIGAAGNQTLGEALYLGKPVLALPESNHHEQMINAHFLRQLGVGDYAPLEAVEGFHFAQFIERLPEYRRRLVDLHDQFNGTPAAVAAIERHLK